MDVRREKTDIRWVGFYPLKLNLLTTLSILIFFPAQLNNNNHDHNGNNNSSSNNILVEKR